MKIAISQPTYLPWIGYFDLMDQVDTFVYLDCVQFEKQSWHHRNRIKTPAGLLWLTVPVQIHGRFGQLIKDVEIRQVDFWQKHLRSVEVHYRRSPYFETYFPPLLRFFEQHESSSLCELNIALLTWMMTALTVQKPTVIASTLQVEGKKSGLLVNICRKLGADEYLSPIGSAEYLLDDMQLFNESGISVRFQHYQHPEYRQLFRPFVPYASALDLLFNEGPGAMDIIRSGRREPWTVAAVTAEKSQSAVVGT